MKKTLAALALAGSIALIGSPAVAATYPALPPQAAVSDGTVGPGETFVFRGQGFQPFETITITVTPGTPPAASGATFGGTSVVAAIPVFQAPQALGATADAQGVTSLPIAISEAGTYSITATGLANTGDDSGLVLWTLVGAGALAAGATSVVVVRRRAKAEAAV